MRRAALLLVVALAAGCSAEGDGEPRERRGARSGEAAPPASLPDLVRKVQPSVVAVIVERGEGSGVIWDDKGLIVTSEHVVRGARRVQILLASGRRIDARVRATDPQSDLALIEVEGKRLPAATIGDRAPRVGEFTLALGNPFGLERTVTAGIVSGVHRTLPGGGPPALVDLIQTDAAISPGNSGGALVNGKGELIGVNVGYIPPQRGAVEVGFAIPADTVSRVVRQLLEDGEAEHAFLGVQPTELWPELVDRLDVDVEAGVLVFAVREGSPAQSAGLERGDVVVAVDGKKTPTVEAFLSALSNHAPGERVTLSVVRDDRRREVSAVLGDRPG